MILVCGSIVRYMHYKDVGRYSLNIARPWRYKVKIVFHLFMLLLWMVLTVYFSMNPYDRPPVDQILRIIISIEQIFMWSLSSFMMLFEYKRALGHVWYVHPLFWWFSIIVYEADVVLWRTQHDPEKDGSDWHLVVAFICASVFSLFLGLLSILFPNDVPYERRDYITESEKHLQE